MKYKMINEELRIATCSISDLTAAQAVQFLNQWDDKAKLSELTLFYDPKTDLLVLNQDNKNFQHYRDIAECYLYGNNEQQRKWLLSAPEGSRETLRVLKYCINWRKIGKEIDIICKNHILDVNAWDVLEEIERRYSSRVAVSNAYRYGVIQGKRAERKKKKGGAVA